MIKAFSIILLIITFVSCDVKVENVDKDKQRIDKVCDQVVDDFKNGLYKEAMNLVKENSVVEPEKIDTLEATIEYQSKAIFPAYGKMISAEFITERKIKDFIAKRFYIVKFERFPIKADFTLYKTPSGWAITTFSYNENLVELLY